MNDIRLAVRLLGKNPGFALTAIVTLALAIGANTAVFSLVDAVLLKPLPYPQPERLAVVSREVFRAGAMVGQDVSHTGAVWEAVRDQVPSVDAAVQSGLSAQVSLVTGDRAVAVRPERVGAGFFRVLGVGPALGREFTADEDRPGGPAAVILGDRLWRSALGGDPAAVGRTILLKGEPHTVVGIMPSSFRTAAEADLWTPVRATRTGEGEGENFAIVLRLREGATWAQATAEIAAAAAAAVRLPPASSGITFRHGVQPLQDAMASDVRRPLLLLWSAVGLVLLVACVNLAGLMLARAGSRAREIATRLAIGGSRHAIVRQLMIESLAIAAIGGLAGVVAAALALGGLKAMADGLVLTPWGAVGLDGRTLLVTMGISVLTSLLFGLAPAWQATRVDVRGALSASGTRAVAGGAGGWPRRLLVVGEVALGVVLLVGAGLLIRTFVHLQSRPTGFDPRGLVAATASLEDARYSDHASVARLFETSLSRMQEIAGVESAAVSLGLPYERILNMGAERVGAEGQPEGGFLFSTATYVTPGYFETLRLPVRRGRGFDRFDGSDAAPVVVINEAFARRHFQGQDPVGQPLRMAGRVRQVVGVVADVPQQGGFAGYGPIDALPGIYVPFAQFPPNGLRVYHGWFSPAWIVREAVPGAVSERALRAAMADVDAGLPLASVRAVDELRAAALGRQRLLMTLVGLLGAAALLLSALGIHGLIAGAVAERTREMGIRLALGSSTGQAVRSVSMPGIYLALAGLAIGVVAAWGASGLVRGLIWGVTGDDPLTYAAVAGTLLAVAVVASVLPARRVRRLDPARLLRQE